MTVTRPPAGEVTVTRIEPGRGALDLGLREIWSYRRLVWFLTWRDLKVRYKQTLLGAGWAIIQPFVMMVVFSIFLGRGLGVPSQGIPYPIFAYSALVPWVLFQQSVQTASNSLVVNQALVTRVYVPRLLLPVASVGATIIDFLAALSLIVGLMFFYSIFPSLGVLWLPALALLAVFTALGVGIWLSALNAMYRDVRYAVPFLLQAWMFATPIVFPPTVVPEQWQWLFGLNPMAGVVLGFRWALLDVGEAPGTIILISLAVSVVVLVTGLLYFRRTESRFVDLL